MTEKWIPASNGKVPENAVIGGWTDDKKQAIVIARAKYKGHLIPGRLTPPDGFALVSLKGLDIKATSYEVLCNVEGTWVKGHGHDVPEDAVAGGETDKGEPLYVARADHLGKMIVGKVQRSTGFCFVLFDGTEFGNGNYEVFVPKFCDYRATWIPSRSGPLPSGAIEGGKENGETLYIARGTFEKEVIPGKFVPSREIAFMAVNGKEKLFGMYEILCNDTTGSWQKLSNIKNIKACDAAGKNKNGDLLYIGRFQHDGNTICGYVQNGTNICYATYKEKVISSSDYELFVHSKPM